MRTILVIDDDLVLCRLIEQILATNGFAVMTVNNGEEGLAATCDKRPDLVLCDINLGGMDGYEVLRRVRQDAATATTPVVLMSGHSAMAGFSLAMSLGADDFLAKPFSSGDLLATISNLIGSQHALH
jgi:DNA-binding response OmpR family regulator